MNKYILVFLLLATMTSITANAAMIDNFDEEYMKADALEINPSTATATSTSTATTTSTSTSLLSTFGGSRTISITKTGYQEANATVIAPPGIYAYSSDASATSTISWHSDTAIDLIEGRSTTNFALDILSIDQGNIDFILSVTDVLNNTDSYTLSGVDTGIQYIALSLFSSTIDFLNITDISLKIEGGDASDLTLNSISTVPTPSVLVLLNMGIVAFGLSRRVNK